MDFNPFIDNKDVKMILNHIKMLCKEFVSSSTPVSKEMIPVEDNEKPMTRFIKALIFRANKEGILSYCIKLDGKDIVYSYGEGEELLRQPANFMYNLQEELRLNKHLFKEIHFAVDKLKLVI